MTRASPERFGLDSLKKLRARELIAMQDKFDAGEGE